MEIEFENGTMTNTEKDSIEDSISTIAGTPYGSAPYLRDMGVKNYPPADAGDIAFNRYASEVITQTGLWEDRAKVREIKYGEDNNVRMVISNG